jgi:hypothetical protein
MSLFHIHILPSSSIGYLSAFFFHCIDCVIETLSLHRIIMKFSVALVGLVSVGSVSAFTVPFGAKVSRSKSTLSMVLEKPVEKKLAKIETLKIGSNHLLHPLQEVRCLLASKRAVVVGF